MAVGLLALLPVVATTSAVGTPSSPAAAANMPAPTVTPDEGPAGSFFSVLFPCRGLWTVAVTTLTEPVTVVASRAGTDVVPPGVAVTTFQVPPDQPVGVLRIVVTCAVAYGGYTGYDGYNGDDGCNLYDGESYNGHCLVGTSDPAYFTVTAAPPTTAVVYPSDGASVGGGSYFGASASEHTTRVEFRLTGPGVTDALLGNAVSTDYGWFLLTKTAAFAEGTYQLRSVAFDGAGQSGTSAPITITIDRQAPSTQILVPPATATFATNVVLDATAQDDMGVTQVEFRATGGPLANVVVGVAALSPYGWIAIWDTSALPEGTYTVRSAAYDAARNKGVSERRKIIIDH